MTSAKDLEAAVDRLRERIDPRTVGIGTDIALVLAGLAHQTAAADQYLSDNRFAAETIASLTARAEKAERALKIVRHQTGDFARQSATATATDMHMFIAFIRRVVNAALDAEHDTKEDGDG